MRIPSSSFHNVWDNAIAPVVTIEPGDTLEVEVRNASGGQIGPDSTAADLIGMDFGLVNPVTGPVEVAGAAPGDALVVEVVDIACENWGWTANIPGFGLLADDFPEPHLVFSDIAGGVVRILGGIEIPSVPMIGTIGMPAAQPGPLPMVPPHRHGGNLDIRDVAVGTTLRLPVAVPGALLSIGDTHAAMGDGEVCGTGIETGSVVTVRVGIEKGLAPPAAVLETDGRTGRTGPRLIATGVGPDIWQAARDAVRSAIDLVVARTGLAATDAYLLLSVAADLHVSEIVDLPNVVVSLHLARTGIC